DRLCLRSWRNGGRSLGCCGLQGIAPGSDGCGDGGGDLLLVVGVGGWGRADSRGGKRGELDCDGGAHHIVEWAQGGSTDRRRKVAAGEGGAESAGEAEALADEAGLGRVPGDGEEG